MRYGNAAGLLTGPGFEIESAGDSPAAGAADAEPAGDGDGGTLGSPDTDTMHAVEPAGTGAEPPPAEPEPPLWATADAHVLHLPRYVLDRICHPGRPPRWRRRRRFRQRPLPLPLRRRRRAALRRVGRLARGARLVGALRSRRPTRRYPVFRARAGGRSYRILTQPRGLRFEIIAIRPELSMAPGIEGETKGRTRRARSPAAALRSDARKVFFAAYPRLRGKKIQVHHRIPLEWHRRLFPGVDPNRLSNLQGLTSVEHQRKATDLWTAFRNAYRRKGKQPTRADVLRFAALVDRSLQLPYPL
ncbi:MAG TPA: HNH endonuclease signature motif containing protein [Longimicrobiales bacterium]